MLHTMHSIQKKIMLNKIVSESKAGYPAGYLASGIDSISGQPLILREGRHSALQWPALLYISLV